MTQQEKDRLSGIQGSAKRMFKGEDGDNLLKFTEHMAGITDFIPNASLEKVEGVKRWYIVLNKMLNSNTATWLEWYENKGKNIFL